MKRMGEKTIASLCEAGIDCLWTAVSGSTPRGRARAADGAKGQ